MYIIKKAVEVLTLIDVIKSVLRLNQRAEI